MKNAIRRQDGELSIFELDTTESTNKDALDYGAKERPDHSVLIWAHEQTAGRGRLGRSFISPRGGLYMTLLLPISDSFDPTALTTYAAVAICRALERLTHLKPGIKWVNDIYVGERKLAGILTQGVIDEASGRITHAAIGIGLNILGKELHPDIRDIATTLEIEGCLTDRGALLREITEEILGSKNEVGTPKARDEYRRRSILIGREINVIKPTATYTATVLDVGPACELIIKLPDGRTEALTTGDVSVRKLK